MKKIIFLLILFLSFTIIYAQKDLCKKYADKAVSQYQLAKKNNIPAAVGLGWSGDWDTHHNWCITVPINIANAENAKRQKIIDNYLNSNQKDNTQFCKEYADKAVSQYLLAKKNNLPNINWPVWTDDWKGHYNWCKTVSQDVVNKGTAKRQAYLDKYIKENNNVHIDDATRAVLNEMVIDHPKMITGQPAITSQVNSKKTISEHYAKKSVRQNKVNISKNCGFKGSSWSSDYNAHKNWCLHGDNYLQVDRILAEREKQLKNCTGDFNNSKVAGAVLNDVGKPQPKYKMITGYPAVILKPNPGSIKLEKGINLPGNDYKSFWTKKGPEFEINECIKACEDDIRCKSFTYVITDRGNKARCYLKNNIPSPIVKENCISGIKISTNKSEKSKTDEYLSKTIRIPYNKTHYKNLISVKKAGLYKINITLFNLNKTSDQIVKISPRINQEDYHISISLDNETAKNQTHFINNSIQGQKKGTGFKPWILSKETIQIFKNIIEKEFYFFVDDQHIPSTGKLQFDLEISGLENINKKKKVKEDFSTPIIEPLIDLNKHPEISGTFDIKYSPTQKILFEDTFDNGTQYSILKIKPYSDSRMQLTVIETPEINLKNIPDDSKKPILSFFIANTERLSSVIDPNSATGFSVIKNPNKWIYKDVLTNEYGENYNCSTITLNGNLICTKNKTIKKDKWDIQPYNKKSRLIDVIDPPKGRYEIVISSNGVDNGSLENLMTTGKLMNNTSIDQDEKNEIIVATRFDDPYKWTFIAELTRFKVSTQAEDNNNDDDDWLGKFSISTTSILSEPRDAENQISLRPYQIISKTHAYPIVGNEDKAHNFCIRTLNNHLGSQKPNNAGAFSYPKIPLFVMDYDTLQNYNSLLINILSTEHDEASFWDEYGKIISLFSSFMNNLISNSMKIVSGFSAGSAVSLGKELYKFASTDLNASNNVDDFMGNAAIALYKVKNFGLGNKDIVSFDIEGPSNISDFDMSSKFEGDCVAECSTNSGNGRSISAVITLRKIRKINGTANIQLISYTPIESPFHGIGSFPTGRGQLLTEGMLSRNHSTWNDFYYTPINAFKEIKVRNYPSTFDDKFAPNSFNKGVIVGTEFNSDKLSENNQDWKGKGFTYFQAEIDDIELENQGRRKTAIISFTLYHEDVIKNAGKGWVDLRNNMGTDKMDEKDKFSTIMINSTQVKNNQYPNRKFYKVDIKLYDPGDWLKEVKLIAYVTIN